MPKAIGEEVVKEKFFESFELGPLTLKNRFVIPPMCTYMSKDGGVNRNHFIHYASLAKGGSSLVIVEATNVNQYGYISDNDLAIHDPKYLKGFKDLVKVIHEEDALAAIQLNHAGRKAKMDAHNPKGLSNLKFSETDKDIDVLSESELDEIVIEFIKAAMISKEAGFDAIEVHAAHGYLIYQSMSPITNTRTDKYGDRTYLIGQVLTQLKKLIDLPIIVRVSATEYVEEGFDIDFVIEVLNKYSDSIDIVHVSSGGASKQFDLDMYYAGYQLDFADQIKKATNKPVIAVGLLHSPELINYALSTGKADAIAIGRACLDNPYYVNSLKK